MSANTNQTSKLRSTYSKAVGLPHMEGQGGTPSRYGTSRRGANSRYKVINERLSFCFAIARYVCDTSKPRNRQP